MNIFLNRNKIDFVLVDWFGVLSTRYYWCIQYKRNALLKEWCDSIFEDRNIFNDWMRGNYSLEELTRFQVKIDANQILDCFMRDINYYKPDQNILNSLNNLFPNAKKILITDNMSLFDHVLRKYKFLTTYFFKIYSSYNTRCLKSDEPFSLFDFALKDLLLKDFQNCVLIDDQIENCKTFKSKGGRVILIN
jgi:FMN phosphatase YigB (HAD superfamily)